MSDRFKSTNNLSSALIIDDLTKSLEFDMLANDVEESPSDEAIPPNDITSQDLSSEAAQKVEHKTDGDSESDESDLDDLVLKDREADLTNDQKSERHLIAEELKNAGNSAFKDGDYVRSIEKYSEAIGLCPLRYTKLRAILFCNRGAAKMKLQKYKQAEKDCNKACELDDSYIKAYHRRAQAYEALDRFDECLADYKKILELDPTHKHAQDAMTRLPPKIEAQNEKLKDEMFDKLKEFGNVLLKPFGLSTSNFKMEQDPETKGYKINFQQ